MLKLINGMRMRDNERGFTLIELLVVVAILAILAAIAIPQFTAYRAKAAKAACASAIVNCISEAAAKYADAGTTGNTTCGNVIIKVEDDGTISMTNDGCVASECTYTNNQVSCP